jgi:short-subunit dehydrogenase
MQIEGKLALITGAGSGIGRELAIEAARRGARLVLVGRRRAALEATQALLPSRAASIAVAGDITRHETRRGLYEHIAATWGKLDILVNNAGLISVGAFADIADVDIDRMITTNLVAPIALTRELLPLLATSARARIVNIGSVFGEIGYPFFAAYSASKFGLRGFSMALRRELLATGVGVTYAAPGATRTDTTEAFIPLLLRMKIDLDDSRRVAAGIWDAVARDADNAYPRGWERLHILAQRLLPWMVDRAVAKQLRDGGLFSRLAHAMPWIAHKPDPSREAGPGPAKMIRRYCAGAGVFRSAKARNPPIER